MCGRGEAHIGLCWATLVEREQCEISACVGDDIKMDVKEIEWRVLGRGEAWTVLQSRGKRHVITAMNVWDISGLYSQVLLHAFSLLAEWLVGWLVGWLVQLDGT